MPTTRHGRAGNLAGVSLMACGASLAGLGCLAMTRFGEPLAGVCAATIGAAMLGGGHTLVRATGALPRLRERAATLLRPAP